MGKEIVLPDHRRQAADVADLPASSDDSVDVLGRLRQRLGAAEAMLDHHRTPNAAVLAESQRVVDEVGAVTGTIATPIPALLRTIAEMVSRAATLRQRIADATLTLRPEASA